MTTFNKQIHEAGKSAVELNKRVIDWQVEQAKLAEKATTEAFANTRAAMKVTTDAFVATQQAFVDAVAPKADPKA